VDLDGHILQTECLILQPAPVRHTNGRWREPVTARTGRCHSLIVASLGKLWKIHFRNVSAPIPHFVETFVDDGYTDMKKVMRTLVDVDFRGILIADHVPQMVGDRRTGWAYSIGYIKALYDMARDERPNR
jgi:D-mannonate dehydratase (UxuA)